MNQNTVAESIKQQFLIISKFKIEKISKGLSHVKRLLLVSSFILFPLFSMAMDGKDKVVTDTIQVKGNCSMCKQNIEGALEIKGVLEADWNPATHQLAVTYNPGKISLNQIEEKIAKAGYDTEHMKADDKAYHKLHSCCQYDR